MGEGNVVPLTPGVVEPDDTIDVEFGDGETGGGTDNGWFEITYLNHDGMVCVQTFYGNVYTSEYEKFVKIMETIPDGSAYLHIMVRSKDIVSIREVSDPTIEDDRLLI